MNHKRAGRKLSRVKNQRKALLKTLLGSLIMREKITTTEAKAKEIKPLMDKLLTLAKKGAAADKSLAALRILKTRIPELAAKKITGEFLKKFDKRNGGYTRIIKLKPRQSDSAKMAVIEFV